MLPKGKRKIQKLERSARSCGVVCGNRVLYSSIGMPSSYHPKAIVIEACKLHSLPKITGIWTEDARVPSRKKICNSVFMLPFSKILSYQASDKKNFERARVHMTMHRRKRALKGTELPDHNIMSAKIITHWRIAFWLTISI
jgi:hypothetical protein